MSVFKAPFGSVERIPSEGNYTFTFASRSVFSIPCYWLWTVTKSNDEPRPVRIPVFSVASNCFLSDVLFMTSKERYSPVKDFKTYPRLGVMDYVLVHIHSENHSYHSPRIAAWQFSGAVTHAFCSLPNNGIVNNPALSTHDKLLRVIEAYWDKVCYIELTKEVRDSFSIPRTNYDITFGDKQPGHDYKELTDDWMVQTLESMSEGRMITTREEGRDFWNQTQTALCQNSFNGYVKDINL
jgi:hypothetical protein